jgi:hypothetical protein
MEDEEQQMRDELSRGYLLRSATAKTSYIQYHNSRLYLKMEQQVRNELSGEYLEISKGRPFMFDNIDSFVALSRENTSVEYVMLDLLDSAPGNYEFWGKVGQIVGNLSQKQGPYLRLGIPDVATEHNLFELPGKAICRDVVLYTDSDVLIWNVTHDALKSPENWLQAAAMRMWLTVPKLGRMT